MNRTAAVLGIGLAALCLSAAPAAASVVISGTRIVVPEREREVVVKLHNAGDTPALVQTWIDRGDPHSTPETEEVPFVIVPALFRMEPERGQSLRVVYTQEPLPQDRESLLWLNVLEIPPRPDDAPGESRNTLQIAIRSRLKLFFRPNGLQEAPELAPERMTWKLEHHGQNYTLKASNPTPYHVTIVEIVLGAGESAYRGEGGMIEPFGSLELPLPDIQPAPGEVNYTVLNDYGAAIALTGSLGR